MAALLLLLLAAVGVALWGGLTGERSLAPRAARPAHAADAGAAPSKGLSSLPLAAQGVVSATLGSANGAYRVTRSGAEYQAVNPAQRLRVRFDRAGVRVQSGQARLGLRLGAVGYGASLAALAPVAPRAHGNRVVYARGGLSEWYANGPLGLEQGFTLTRAPIGDVGKPLTLSLALSGDVRASVDADGRGATLNAPGSTSLRYDNLLVSDARGRALPSWITLHAGGLLLHVDARGARYPLRIDPLVQQGKKLTVTGEEGKAFTGYSVALSANGNTALVGGYEENSGDGAAWVFIRSGINWEQQAKLTRGAGSEGAEGWFGIGVALSEDGSTALVGAPLDHGSVGAAWAYTYSSGTKKWEPMGKKITGAEEIGTGNFGHGVALSGDGKTALIGGFGDSSNVGAVWVFTWSGTEWEQQGKKLTGEEEEPGEVYFGFSVALSGDGKTALVGGHVEKGHVGAAWAFAYSSGTKKWEPEGKKLIGGEEEIGKGDFGYSVALSENGNTALIGAFGDHENVGAAWVFTWSGTKWEQQGKKLTGSEESGEGWFGFSVALTHNGNTALIGGSHDKELEGAVWEFKRSEGKWTQQGKKLTGEEEIGAGSFGSGVALSSEGTTAFIGGEADHEDLGAAWAFTLTPEFLLAEWLVGGAVVTTELSTQTSGELSLEDTKTLIGKAKVLCSFILDGWVGPNGLGWVSEVLNLAGEAISSTPLSGLALECAAQAACESGTAPKVWPVGLGWETEVEFAEYTSNFFALLSLPHSGGSNPGWDVECLVLGAAFSDECKAPEGVAELALEGTTLLGKLSQAFTELAKGTLALCSQSGEETGVFEGENSITLTGGGELTASSGTSVS